MGVFHSNHKSYHSFEFENKGFPYNSKCPFEEDDRIAYLPGDISFTRVYIPCSGSIPDLRLLKESWISGCPNPQIANYRHAVPYKIKDFPDGECTSPYFGASGQYSLIRLTNSFTKFHLINTSDVEACLGRLLILYEDKIDSRSLPSFIGAPKGPAPLSALYRRLHVLICRLVYHQIMCQKKMLYFGSADSTILTHDGVKYALIQHPNFNSLLFREPAPSLFSYYPLDFLHSLQIKSYELTLFPLNLIRSAFSFHSYPIQYILYVGLYRQFIYGQPNLIMPFSLLYLDCISTSSVDTLYSFILHHIFARNTGLTVYNTHAPIIVVMINSTLIDRGIFIDENMVLSAFEKYLSILPRIYLTPSCPPQEPKFSQSYDSIYNISSPSSHYFDTPCDAIATVPPRPQDSKTVISFSTEDYKSSYTDWAHLLNSFLLPSILPYFLPILKPLQQEDKKEGQKCLEYINSFPLFNLSKYLSFLPLAQTQYPALIQRFQWHNFERAGIQPIQLTMLTCLVKTSWKQMIEVGLSPESPESSKSHESKTTDKLPLIVAMYSTRFSRNNFNFGVEYLVGIQNRTVCSADSYLPVQLITNHIDTASLQSSPSHIKMFAPSKLQLEETKILEQNILEQLDEEYRYSLEHARIAHITHHNSTYDDSATKTMTEPIVDPISDPIVDLIVEPKVETFVKIEYNNFRPRLYQFDYRGENQFNLGKPYTADINYYVSSQRNDIEIKIISPDLYHTTKADRNVPLVIPLPTDVSATSCALPMNQIIAIDAYLSITQPQMKKESRYLVQLANNFGCHHFSDLTHSFHPYLCPAICIVSPYDPKSCLFTYSETSNFDSFRSGLFNFNINVPLIFVCVLPENFDIKFFEPPTLTNIHDLVFEWDLGCRPHDLRNTQTKEDKEDKSDTKEPHSQAHIESHCNIILQYMKHVSKYITEPLLKDPLPPIENSNLKQRTVYYFVVKGLAGYIECLPRINQCALAHFFCFGMQNQ